MIISPDSFFRSPPKNLEPIQVLTFDGIRYSIDICDITFSRLKENLYDFSFSSKDKGLLFPSLFADVWTIINNATIFYNIVTNLFKISKEDDIFEGIRGIEFLRHSQQHIDERIKEILLDNELPIYGNLSWFAKENKDLRQGKIFSINSGTITHFKKNKLKFVNPVEKNNDDVINDIEFTMVIKINKGYQKHTINIKELIVCLTKVINHLEWQMEEQLKDYKTFERHKNDLILILDFK